MSNRPSRPRRPSLALLLPTVVLTLAACAGSGAAPTSAPTNGPTGTAQPTPTAVPGDPGTGGGTGSSGGGGTVGSGGNVGGKPGGGLGGLFPGDPNQNPILGQATYVTPGADLINQHPVNVQLVRAIQLDSGGVVADLRWWSGVAPCSQLDHVEIARDDAAHTIRFTVFEGSGKGDMACIDIAQLTATTVDLGTLAPGAWKLSANGDAPEINLDVQ